MEQNKNILEIFAEKYLDYFDIETPINNGIVTNGDCFFHALVYASGDGLQDTAIDACIDSTRKDVSDLYIKLLRQNLTLRNRIKQNRLIEEVQKFRVSENYAEQNIIRQGIVYTQKAMIILTPSKNVPSQLNIQIITNEDIGLRFTPLDI